MHRTSLLALPVCVALGSAPLVLGQAGDPFQKPIPPVTPTPRNPTTTQPEKPIEPKVLTVDLRPRFRKGEELRYVLELDGKNKIKSVSTSKDQDPIDMEQTNSQRIGLIMRVKEAGDEGATIDVVYDSIKIVLDTPDGKAEYDSAKKKATPNSNPKQKPGTTPKGTVPDPLSGDMSDLLAQIVGPMVGTTLEVKTDKNGVITSVTGGAALGGSGIESLLGGAGGAAGMMPDAKSVANWLVGGTGGPPNPGAVRIGESWTNTDSLAGTPVGGFKLVTTHTLKSLSRTIANVMFSGRAETTDSEGSPSPLGSLVKLRGASYRGQYQWDTSAGCLKELSSELSTQMTGKIGEQNVEMTSSATTRVRKQ